MSMTESETRLVGAAAIAEAFGVSERTVQRLALAGVLPAVRVGGSWKFDPSEVAAHIALEGSGRGIGAIRTAVRSGSATMRQAVRR